MTLLIADQHSHCIYTFNKEKKTVFEVARNTVLAEHSGFLQLADGRIAYGDDARGELVLLKEKCEPAYSFEIERISASIPAEHITTSPNGRWIAISTGFGAAFDASSDQITLIDLQPSDSDRPLSYRVRTRAGEPGIALSNTHIWLRHREPGAIQTIPIREIITAGPHVPPVASSLTSNIGDSGHGDAYDPHTNTFHVATENGIEHFTLTQETPQHQKTLTWHTITGTAARAYFLRFNPHKRLISSTLRLGGDSPKAWDTWKNWVFTYNIDTGKHRSAPVGTGLVFRCALTPTALAVTRVHPDGDELVVYELSDLSIRGRWQLPVMDGAPRKGAEPWDNADRRSIAADPESETVAVTRGGHGQIHLIDVSTAGGELETYQVPTPLKDGGHLGWFSADTAPEAMDGIGR